MANQLYFEASGSGKTVVLLPGMLGSSRLWQKITPTLSRKYKVVAIDLLGFGRSPKPQDIEYSLRDHTESVDRTLASAKIKPPFTLIGHSMGALVALSYTAQFGDKVSKLILVNPPLFKNKNEVKENMKEVSALPLFLLYGPTARVVCRIFCQALRPFTAFFLRLIVRDIPKNVINDSLLHTYYSYMQSLKNIVEDQNIQKDFQKINIPVEIIYGEKDRRINLSILKEISGGRVNIKEVKGAGHFIPLEKPQMLYSI